MAQLPLFDDTRPAPEPFDPTPRFTPRVVSEAVPRLSKQCAAILARLQRGRATNRELAALALKYTSRISDLRDAGYGVECVEEDKASGLSWYELRAR